MGRKKVEAGGDNGGGLLAETPGNQVDSGGAAGDNDGEATRRDYVLDAHRIVILRDAREADARLAGEGEVADQETAFWRAAGDAMGFNSVTVQPSDDIFDTGAFSAWPTEHEPRAFNPATNEADHAAQVEKWEKIADELTVGPEGLGKTLIGTMIDILHHRHKPWGDMTKIERGDVHTAIEYAVTATVRKAVLAIAAEGRPGIRAKLESYADKGGQIKVTLSIAAADDDAVLALHRASGKEALIITAAADGYLSGSAADLPDDQNDLPFAAGNDLVEPGEEDEDEQEEQQQEEEAPAGDN
jgi:hypothetical protein